MSDELIEGHALRGQLPAEPPEAPADKKPAGRRLKDARPTDEPTGPYIALEPPPEAGDVLARQAEMDTFHRGMQPVVVEDKPTTPPPAPGPQAGPAEEAPLAPDLPWSVIEAAAAAPPAPEAEEPPPAPQAAEPPPAPTPEPPAPAPAPADEPAPEPIMRLPALRLDEEKPAAPRPLAPAEDELPPSFIPDLRTPPIELPPVKEEEPASQPPDVIPELHTPPLELLPVKEEEPASPPPDALPELHTPPLELLPVKEEEPASPPPDFIPQLHTPTGKLPPVSEEEEDFIPHLHTPTTELPQVPEAPPEAAPEEETSGEVVEAEWVVDLDRRSRRERRAEGAARGDISERLEQVRRKKIAEAAAEPEAAPRRKKPAPALTAMAVVVLTVLAIVIPLALRFVLGGGGILPPAGGSGTQTPTGLPPVAALTAATPGEPTPTATVTPIPAYAQGRLAFSSNRDGNFEIYVLDLHSGQTTRLTNDPAADRSPKWSPDGRQILFVSDRSGDDDLYVMPASGGQAVKLTSDPGSDRNPDWSPDGDRIVFTRETVDGSHLVTFPTTCLPQPETCESNMKALTPGGYDLFPAWSPDGSRIAFAGADYPGMASVIALINPDGSGYAALPGTATSDTEPAWSPDGSRIAFVSYAQGDYDLWVMAADGSGLTQFTRSEAFDVEPAWSPTGSFIVFASDRDGDFELYLIGSACQTPDTGCDNALIPLTTNSADDLNPDWTP